MLVLETSQLTAIGLEACTIPAHTVTTSQVLLTGCGFTGITIDHCTFQALTQPNDYHGIALHFATPDWITITSTTFSNSWRGGGIWEISLASTKQLLLDKTSFTYIAGLVEATGALDQDSQLWFFDMFVNDADTYDPMVKAHFHHTYCDGLEIANAKFQYFLEWDAPPEVPPILRRIVAENIKPGTSLFGWGEGINGYAVIESSSFTNSVQKYESLSIIYFEGCNFSAGSGTYLTYDPDWIGLYPEGKVSVVNCRFNGFQDGLHPRGEAGAGVAGFTYQVLVCGSTFTNCFIGLNLQDTTYCDAVNCQFTGYKTSGIKLGGSGLKLVRCAFYAGNGGTPITGGMQGGGVLELESLCFSGVGPFISTTAAELKRAINCCFPGAEAQAVIGLSRYYNDPVLGKVDVTLDGFECVLPCDANNATLTDVSVCTSGGFPRRPTPYPTDAKIFPPEPGDVPTPEPTRPPASSDLPSEAATEPIASTLPEAVTPTPTAAVTPTSTEAATPTSTDAATPTATEAATPTATDAATPTSTEAATPTATEAATPTATEAATPTSTDAATPTSTDAATPTSTDAATPTSTDAATPSSGFPPSEVFTQSEAFIASLTIHPTWVFTPSNGFVDTGKFSASEAFKQSNGFPVTAAFPRSVAFAASNVFAATAGFSASLGFPASHVFPATGPFSPSLVFRASEPIQLSGTFTAPRTYPPRSGLMPQATVYLDTGVADAATGLSTGAAVGAGVGGFAALAGLVLLFLLLKRRKKPEPVLEEETVMDETAMEDDEYISEYGLSGGGVLMDDIDGAAGGDEPVVDPGNYESDQENISERNPDDFENEADEI